MVASVVVAFATMFERTGAVSSTGSGSVNVSNECSVLVEVFPDSSVDMTR